MAKTTPAVEEHRENERWVWKFGYGSNMSLENLRQKKGLKPLDGKRVSIGGFSLSFPEGNGIDFVEPLMGDESLILGEAQVEKMRKQPVRCAGGLVVYK